MGVLSYGRDVLAVAIIMVLSSSTTHALFVDRESPIRQVCVQESYHLNKIVKIYVASKLCRLYYNR